MRKTDLNIFYELGHTLGYLCGGNCRTGQDVAEINLNLILSRQWLVSFLRETVEYKHYLKDSRKAATDLYTRVNDLMMPTRLQAGHPVTQQECCGIFEAKEEFEKCLEREARYIRVFTVTPKGTRDTAILMETPEDDFTDKQQQILPPQFVVDLRQAARCLVFEVPTACAFHICKATESLILAYYKVLAQHDWNFDRRNWNLYIQQLEKENAPKKITTRLNEIREMDRNAYAHPEVNVSLEEAPILYSLCAGVNFYMAEEMVRLLP